MLLFHRHRGHVIVTQKSTIEFGLGQDATTDDEAILLIAHVESRNRRVMRYLYMQEVLDIKRSVLLKAEIK